MSWIPGGSESGNIRMDLAFYLGKKGVLRLNSEKLTFTPHKGESVQVDLVQIQRISFEKTAMVTSTLFVNDMEITVCRAHLWYQDIVSLIKLRTAKSII